MADTHETDHPGVTTVDAMRELFAQMPGKDVVWLADQIVAIAQHLGSLSLCRVPESGAHAIVCRADSVPSFSPGRDALRLFRPLLARFAVLGADETGDQPQLYGGRFELVRSSRTGPVRLEVVFANTPGDQHLTITRVPFSAVERTEPATAVGADHAPHPSV